MPIFELQTPDGQTFEVDAPDAATAARSLESFSQQPQQGNSNYWSTMDQGLDTLTMGGSTKLGAAGGSIVDSLFGMARGEGFNYSENYNKNLERLRANQAAYNEENPVRTAAGNAAGVALGVTSLPTFGKGLMGAAGTGAGYGGAGGALQDADTVEDRAWNTAKGVGFGGLLGGTVYGAAKGISSLLGAGKTAPPPTAEKWHETASDLYKAADNGFGTGGVSVEDVNNLANKFDEIAGKAGEDNPFGPIANKPYQQTIDTVQQFRKIAGDIAAGNTSQPNYSHLEQLRQSIRAQASSMVAPNGKMTPDGMRMNNLLEAVDSMLLNSPYEEARAAYATAIKADLMQKAFSDAELSAGSNYTQAGMEKAIQGEFKKIAKSKNFTAMFTPEEQAAIKNVVNPGGVQKAMKLFGGMAPKGGLSLMFNVGMATSNPYIGIPLGVASTASKMGSTAKTINNARMADELIRSQGAAPQPVNQQMVQQLQRILLPSTGLLGDQYLRAEYGGPR